MNRAPKKSLFDSQLRLDIDLAMLITIQYNKSALLIRDWVAIFNGK